MPVIIYVSVIFLGLIVIVYVRQVSSDFGNWYVRGTTSLPFDPMVRSIVLCVVPVLAILNLVFKRPSGRYLALVPMLVLLGAGLRLFTNAISTPRYDLYPRYFTPLLFGIVISLATLILTLGFSKKVDDYHGA